MILGKVLRPKGRSMNSSSASINPLLVQVPNGIYHGWKCISEEEAIIINVPTEVYVYNAPDEYRLPPHGKEIPYDWARKDG